MSYRPSRSWSSGGGGILGFPPVISQIVLVNVIVFLLQPLVLKGLVGNGLALVPVQVLSKGMVWELVTYMFLHGDFMHILFNMFILVMLGSELERYWGSRDFLKYYFITGVGAGLIHMVSAYLLPGGAPGGAVIGASGAVLGVLIAFGLAFPDRTVLLFMVIPIRARTLVIIYAIMELALAAQYQSGDGVARFAHLGGMLVGYVYLKHETLGWQIKRLLRKSPITVSTGGRRPSPKQDAEMKEEIDRILDKISREGMGSLTKEERRVLAESAERARKRQQPDA